MSSTLPLDMLSSCDHISHLLSFISKKMNERLITGVFPSCFRRTEQEKAPCEAVKQTQLMHCFHQREKVKKHDHRKTLELEDKDQLSSLAT